MEFRIPASEAAKLDAVKPEIGRGLARAAAAAEWTYDDTERWLTDFPLPATFVWNGCRAYPRYTAKKGYGFWLRTAGPYHPALRGLFVLCHDLIAALRPGIDNMPSGELLATILLKLARTPANLPWSEEDRAVIDPTKPNPAENVPFLGEPTGNPSVSHRKPIGVPPETHGEPTAIPPASDCEPNDSPY